MDGTHQSRGDEVIEEARRQLRAPAAAGVAGILFAILFTLAIGVLRGSLPTNPTDEQIAAWFRTGDDVRVLIGGLYLAPFSGIAFLWFVAVVRDQIGDREDRFFATVFFGSGLLFVALVFVSAAAATSLVVGVRLLGQDPPAAETVDLLRAFAYAVMYAFATRAAALFVMAVATIGRRTGVFPRWFSVVGYLIGLILLFFVSIWDSIILVLPAWAFVLSLFILIRERARRRSVPPASAA